jgi:hypothetical protein
MTSLLRARTAGTLPTTPVEPQQLPRAPEVAGTLGRYLIGELGHVGM